MTPISDNASSEEYLNKRAKKASRKKFQAVLDKVPDVELVKYDKL
jgi:hypothetical protein